MMNHIREGKILFIYLNAHTAKKYVEKSERSFFL